MHTRYEIMNIR